MIAGKRPFAGASKIDTMGAILKADAADLGETTPPALERIVRRCLEKKPEDRFESARDLGFALESVSGGSSREKVAPRNTSRKPMVWAGAAAAAILLLLAGWITGRSRATASVPQFHRVAFRRGGVAYAVFSNDGKTIVCSAAWDGKPYEIFSTQESSPESRALGISNAFPVSISKSGEMALIQTPIVRWAETPGTLARVPISGGAPREVAEDVFLADWSPDGTQLAVTRGTATGQKIEYPIGQKILENAGFIIGLKISPKGDRIAFIDNPLGWDSAGYVTVIDTHGQRKVSSRRWGFATGVAWSPDGSEIWFTAGQSGTMTQLYAMNLKGHERLIAPLPGYFWITDIAADGRVLLGQSFSTTSLLAHPRGSAQETDLYWHDFSKLQDLSPDGQQILFSEGGDATTTDFLAFTRKTDGSPAVRLGDGYPTAFSPDGQWAMVNTRTQPAQLLALPLHAGESHPLTNDTIHHMYGRWLPDGKRIVFVGAEPGHRPRYYVQESLQSDSQGDFGRDYRL
jgi:Tol biopolymer transport system component